MFRFASFAFVNFLWIVPVLVVIALRSIYRKRKILAEMGEEHVVGRLHRATSYARQSLKELLPLTAVTFCVLALMGPQMGTVLTEVKRKGIDIVIVLDVSRSMQAEDVSPSRLDRAKFEISRFIDRLEGDRVSLVAFAGTAYIQTPLTLDYSALRLMLDVIDTDIIGTQGTAIADALEIALEAFKGKEGAHKAIILLTDGEDHEKTPVEIADRAAKEGVTIFTVGVGSIPGAPIPLYDKRGRQIGFKRDDEDKIVTSRLNETVLDEIAGVTGGRYFRLTNRSTGLGMVFDEISKIEKSDLSAREFSEYREWFQYLLAVAILMMMIELFIQEKRKITMEWHGRFR